MVQFNPPVVSRDVRSDLIAGIGDMPASRLLGLHVAGFDAAGLSVIEIPYVMIEKAGAAAAAPRLVKPGTVAQGGRTAAARR